MRATVILVLFAAIAFGQAPGKERANLRGQRYCEVLLVSRHGLATEAKVYNTLGLNECPDGQWNAMDAEKIAKEKNVSRVVKNGPRYFVMDRNALMSPVGGVDSFGGMQMRELATVQISLKQLINRQPYVENEVARQSQYVYEAGKYVYELMAPGGAKYIMQSYSLEIDKSLNEEALKTLGSRLKLPKGWQFQATKLDQELTVRNTGGHAFVLQDNLQDSYQKMQ